MIDFTHEDIERLWNSITHYVPERQKLDCAIAKGLDQKQWQITNIVKLRVAGMEDADIK
jgi:hypothetical protein